jgi:hypothetical protein
MPFVELCAMIPLDGRRAVLAYAQSRSLMEYIQVEYGNIVLSEMVAALADGADCESVVSRVLNISLARMNQDWLRSLSSESTITQFWQSSSIWLLLLFAGFGLMVIFFWPINKKDD